MAEKCKLHLEFSVWHCIDGHYGVESNNDFIDPIGANYCERVHVTQSSDTVFRFHLQDVEL